MTPVASIDYTDMRCNVIGNKMCSTAISMPDNEHVNMHGFQVAQGIQQGFTLGSTGLGDVDIQYVCRQAFCSQFKGGARACAGLEEQIDDCLAAQQWYFLYSLFSYAGKGFRCIEYVIQ